MNTEQAKQLSEDAINRLMEALESGQSETLKNYLRVMSRFHKYSWGNVLMIYSQRPDATHVAGFQTWLGLNRHVRKGEKGIVILAPMVGRKKQMKTVAPCCYSYCHSARGGTHPLMGGYRNLLQRRRCRP